MTSYFKRVSILITSICAASLFASVAFAEAVPVQDPSSEEDIKNALTGGVPGGRWKEGLLFEGVRPMPWLKSAANWFPGTEEVRGGPKKSDSAISGFPA